MLSASFKLLLFSENSEIFYETIHRFANTIQAERAVRNETEEDILSVILWLWFHVYSFCFFYHWQTVFHAFRFPLQANLSATCAVYRRRSLEWGKMRNSHRTTT